MGSAVAGDDPRDLDVVVVLTDDLFLGRYDAGSVEEWAGSHGTGSPHACWGRWARDVAKQSAELTRMLRFAVDLKVQPASFFAAHPGPRLLLTGRS